MGFRMLVVVVAMAMFVAGGNAQTDCSMVYASLEPCLTYVTGTATTPGSMCCGGLGSVQSSSPSCLCTVVAELQANPSVNNSKVYSLPADCGVKVDASQCPAFAAPPLPTSLPPGFGMPPGLSAPPLPSSLPPHLPPLSAPPLQSGLPPTSIPYAPTVAPAFSPIVTPPSGPAKSPAFAPTTPTPPKSPSGATAGAPAFAPTAKTPSSSPTTTPVAPGPRSSPSGHTPAPAPATGGASSISASMAMAAALTGAVVAFVL